MILLSFPAWSFLLKYVTRMEDVLSQTMSVYKHFKKDCQSILLSEIKPGSSHYPLLDLVIIL